MANSDLRWERTREFNAGFDATLWEGRLVLTVEYYDKKTTDLLMWQKVPVVSNVDQVLRNVGSVSNKGWDFSIGGTPFLDPRFLVEHQLYAQPQPEQDPRTRRYQQHAYRHAA